MRKDFMNPTLCGFRISLNMWYLNVCNRSQLISANFCLPTFFLYSVLCQMTLLLLVDLYLFITYLGNWKGIERIQAKVVHYNGHRVQAITNILELNITELETFRTLSLIKKTTPVAWGRLPWEDHALQPVQKSPKKKCWEQSNSQT